MTACTLVVAQSSLSQSQLWSRTAVTMAVMMLMISGFMVASLAASDDVDDDLDQVAWVVVGWKDVHVLLLVCSKVGVG